MRPLRPGLNGQVQARQRIVLPGTRSQVGRENIGSARDIENVGSVEVPRSGRPRDTVVVPGPQAEGNLVGEGETQVRSLQRVRVVVIGSRAAGIELIAEDVVVEAMVRACQGSVPAFGAVVTRIRSET